MSGFTTPRTDAAELKAYFRARAIDRMRGRADRVAALARGLDEDRRRRNRISLAPRD